MAIVRLKEFEEDFESEELEILALLKDESGGGLIYNEDYIRPLAGTYAIIDCRTGILRCEEGILMWLVTKDHSGWGFDFKRYGIYKLLVRKAKEKPLRKYEKKSWNNRYLVLDIIESDVKQSQLEAIAADMQQPRVITTRTGEFILNRKYDWYERKTSDYEITLELEEDSKEDCSTALQAFESYELDLPGLDSRLKKYAAEKMLDDANEWREDDGEPAITEKEFAEMISLTGLTFYNDGTADAYYDDGDSFAGHCIVVNIDENGMINEAYIAG